jgi:hypothetical protein
MKVKEEFFERGKVKIGNRVDTRFWEDTWLGNSLLANQYPSVSYCAKKTSFSCTCHVPSAAEHRFPSGTHRQ